MAPVMLRLDVEAMKYQVIHAFAQHSLEIEEEINKAIAAVLKDFDFVTIVRAEAEKALKKATQEAVANAMSSLMWNEPVRKILTDGAASLVRDAVLKSIEMAQA